MIEYRGVQIPSTPSEWQLAGSARAEKKATKALIEAARRAVDMKAQGATSEQAYAVMEIVARDHLDAAAHDSEPRGKMWVVAEQAGTHRVEAPVPDLEIDFRGSLNQEELLAMTGEAHRLADAAGPSTQVGLAWHSIGRALEQGATRRGHQRKKQRGVHARARQRRLGNPDARAILQRAMRGT